jgi:hypothetical protein
LSRLKIWQEIPDGSEIKVQVETSEGATARALCHSDAGIDEDWDDSQLVPGPKRKTLEAPQGYSISVTIDFAKEAKAIIFAVIAKEGKLIKEPYVSPEITGERGSQTVTLIAITEQPSTDQPGGDN